MSEKESQSVEFVLGALKTAVSQIPVLMLRHSLWRIPKIYLPDRSAKRNPISKELSEILASEARVLRVDVLASDENRRALAPCSSSVPSARAITMVSPLHENRRQMRATPHGIRP
jgi:hypothetical protein